MWRSITFGYTTIPSQIFCKVTNTLSADRKASASVILLYNKESLLSENKLNLCLWKFKLSEWHVFQEEGLSMNWQLNQGSSMVKHQTRDLEVRVPVQVKIFPLKSDRESLLIIT
jgi:hypothetical protein